MLIRWKILIAVAALSSAVGAAQYFVQRAVIEPSFASLEHDAAVTDMDRVEAAIGQEMEHLQTMSTDWGDWDGTYRFMEDRHEDFIVQNIMTDALKNLRVDAIAFVDLTGKFAWARAVQSGSLEPLRLDFITRGTLLEDSALGVALRSATKARAYVQTDRGLMLAAIAPILNGNHQGPSRGSVILGRLLTDQEIVRIGEQAHTDVTQVRSSNGGANLAQIVPGLAPSATEAFEVNDSELTSYRVLMANATPLTILKLKTRHTITERGRTAMRTSLGLMLVGAVIALLVLLLLLHWIVVRPLGGLVRQTRLIGSATEPTSTIEVSAKDELGELALEFNEMIERLAQMQKRLVDQSFSAGVAENASGILHNLGNAITPLGAKVHALRDRLKSAPAADIALVMDELNGAVDPIRRADLDLFLQMTAQELTEILSLAEGDSEDILRYTHDLQTILLEQSRHSHAPKLLEVMKLADLIEQGAELVAPELRSHLTLEMDASLANVGSVRLARTVMRQVVQNLIVNAAQALPPSGRGQLCVSAKTVEAGGRSMLELIFADNGAGISPANLKNIFVKHFSTKSQVSNAGIGLHWCANSLNALGGALRVDSLGLNMGATFTIAIPLDQPEAQRAA
jgi:two-component system, NtrC family, sensor kinase